MSTTTRERPILFSSPMVRAILAGTKTVTRRVVKPQPKQWHTNGLGIGCDIEVRGGVAGVWGPAVGAIMSDREPIRCPYGVPGDRLWVRETWREIEDPAAKRSECSRITVDSLGDTQRWVCDYAADNPTRIMDKTGRPRWKPSIHMPRRLSRITLEIAEVRVQRLREISPRDAWAEGVKCPCMKPTPACLGNVDSFRTLWDSINGKTYPWDSDPWVWALTFRRVR